MRKTIAILLAVFVICVTISGCSNNKTNEDESKATQATSTTAQADVTSINEEGSTQSPESTTTTKASKEDKKIILSGIVDGNTYINRSLGFKIVPPKDWKYEKNESTDYTANITTPMEYGSRIKSVSVNLIISTQFKSTGAWKSFALDKFNSDPEYMTAKSADSIKIAEYEYARIDLLYPATPDANSTTLAVVIDNTLVTISFSFMTDKEISSFVKNNIIDL